MIGSWDIENLDKPELFFDLARAYLDSCLALCSLMQRDDFVSTFSRSKVVLSLSFHSVELFLKGAILQVGNRESVNGHDLEKLEAQYMGLCPGDEYRFEIPFKTEYFGATKKEIQELKKEAPPKDQTFRYHTDLFGNKWDGAHGFDVTSFFRSMTALKQDIARLEALILSEK